MTVCVTRLETSQIKPSNTLLYVLYDVSTAGCMYVQYCSYIPTVERVCRYIPLRRIDIHQENMTPCHPSRTRVASTMSYYPRIGCQVLLRSRGVAWGSKPRYVSSLDKMLGIFEDYRKSQWPQELPSRVLKEILKATDENRDDKISVEELDRFLERIGASDKMSMTELADVMTELGVKDDKVDIKVLKEKLAEKGRMH